MARIFLCHASEDKPQVREVYQQLKAIEGFEPWLDEEDLLPGQVWEQEIPRALRTSAFILVFLSQNSVTKQGYVQREMKLALDALQEMPEGMIHTIPVRLDACDVPAQFRRYHYANLFETRGFERLVQAIQTGRAQRQSQELEVPQAPEPLHSKVPAIPETPLVTEPQQPEPIPPKTSIDIGPIDYHRKRELRQDDTAVSRTGREAAVDPLYKHPVLWIVISLVLLVLLPVIFSPPRHALTVETIPPNGLVTIVDTGIAYTPGVKLEPDLYTIRVERGGYASVEKTVAMTDTDVSLAIILFPKTVAAGLPKTITAGPGMEFVLIPAGTFLMGSDKGHADEKPVHHVTISQPFYLGKYEVTQGQWEAVMESNPSRYKGDPSRPVEFVSWNDVQTFLQRLNAQEAGSPYRLPTEAEWEYAARAGTTTAYSFGDDPGELGRYVWYGKGWDEGTQPVGQLFPNSWGLYDMYGNVWEWVSDWYGRYTGKDEQDPPGPSSGTSRVVRGGSFVDSPAGLRSADRDVDRPAGRRRAGGFRCVRVPPQP